MPQQYLDANGNPVAAPTKVYLDPSTGEAQGGTTSSTSTPKPGILSQIGDWWDKTTAPVTEIQPHNMTNLLGTNDSAPTASQVGHELVRGAGNIGAAGLNVLLHPLDTLEGMGKMALRANPVGTAVDLMQGRQPVGAEMAHQFMQQPLETVESGIGQAGALPILEGAAKVPIKAAMSVPKVARGAANIIAGTGTGVAEGLADDTQTANAASQAKADTANSKIVSDRAKQLQQHFEQTQAVRAQNEAAQAAQSRKVALSRGVEQLDPKFQGDLQATEKNVRAQAGANYDAVREATAGAKVPASSLTDAVRQAETNIEGSSENLKVFRDILSRSPAPDDFVVSGGAKFGPGTALYDSVKASPEGMPGAGATTANFSDLQGYYTELGSQLSKGNLPADVYRATKALQGSIGDLMQQMAESKGVGDQLTQARGFYSDYMNAFRDSSSPLYKAMNATERGKSIAALKGADQAGIQTLARYNPDLAQRANTIRGYQAEAKSLPSRTPPPKAEPTLPTPKPPVLADVKKIGLGDIQNAKTDALQTRADSIRNRGGHLATSLAVFDAMRNLFHGNIAGAGEDVALRTAYGLGKQTLANVLSRPDVVQWLTKPTPADIAAIPPDIRANLPQITQAAQAQGIAVHPAILSLAGVTQRTQ